SCPEDELDKNWQRLVLSHIQEKQHLGVLTGFPITDIKVTLIAGKAHIKHTEGGDFRQATYRALRQGLMQASSVLLEPWYNFYLEVPYENIGRAISDLQFMNAEYNPPLTKDNFSVITGSVPVACIQDYQIKVANYTSGKGKISYTLKGYFPCHNSDEVIAQINYNADSDLENTADSVFCTHGAGFVVKWNKVYEYMHIESKLNKQLKKAEISKEKNIIARTASYCASLQEDKELLKIFENTYGPIKRDVYKAFDTEKSLATEYSAPNTKSFNAKTEYLLVDGYNVIFAWDDLNELAKKSLDDARNKLIHTLCNYQGVKQCNIILVFDAYKIKGNLGEIEKFHNITVVYTKEAETADMYIEKVTHDICKDNFVRVVTSDGLEQLIILGHGAFRVSALAFKEEVKQVENTIREF
ncbi:MAG: NYN domain-containing protein, partial [Oscillospiraceae bacterium]